MLLTSNIACKFQWCCSAVSHTAINLIYSLINAVKSSNQNSLEKYSVQIKVATSKI